LAAFAEASFLLMEGEEVEIEDMEIDSSYFAGGKSG
jgi:hypothetical protein